MNKTIWLLAALLISPIAWAETKAPAEQKKMESSQKVKVLGGPIVTMDKAKNTITIERNGKEYPVQLGKGTSLRSGKETITVEKLSVGDRVNVNYTKAGSVRNAISLDRYYSPTAKMEAPKKNPVKEAKKAAPANKMAEKPAKQEPAAATKAEKKPATTEVKAPKSAENTAAKEATEPAKKEEAKTPAVAVEKSVKEEAKQAKKAEKEAKKMGKAEEKPSQEVTSKEE